MTFNFDGPDIGIYRLTYDNFDNSTFDALQSTYMEWGFATLMILGNKIGLDFFAFRIIISFVCLWLFSSTIKYYKANGNLIIGLYMFYLFFFDTIQLRNSISQFIILFATRYLFKKSWSSTVKYILCVIAAASIHSISWVYLIFLLVKVSRRESFFKNILVFAGILFSVSIIIQSSLPQIISLALSLVGHGAGYLQSRIHYGYWIVLGIQLIGFIPLYLYRNRVKNRDTKDKINLIIKLNVILCLFLPLTLINNNFNRIFRNNMILTQIGLVIMFANTKKHSRSRQATFVSLVLFTAGWCFSDMLRYELSNILVPIIEKNLILTLDSSANIGQYVLTTLICLLIFFIVYLFKSKKHVKNYNRKINKGMRQSEC